MHRRDFLATLGSLGITLGTSPILQAAGNDSVIRDVGGIDPTLVKDAHRLEIAPISLEIAKGQVLKTVGYNGGSPGPVLRMREGMPTALEVLNRTAYSETVHPHGQHVPVEIDGTPHEGSPVIPPGGHYRFLFTPGPAGTRWYHSHVHTHGDEARGLYSGQQGVIIVANGKDPGNYDQEVVLITHEWEKLIRSMSGEDAAGPTFSINGKALGHAEPLRVRQGERVLFRVVNGNAEEEIHLFLPGHEFEVIALDGNPVPRRAKVNVIRLGSGERVDALVDMRNPGIWVLGDVREKFRNKGLGMVVEYRDQKGRPQWRSPGRSDWDYTLFGSRDSVREPDEQIELVFDRGPRTENRPWQINGKPFWDQEPYQLQLGRRYRLVFRDKSNRLHPLHLHRHSFELANVEGKPTSGIIKDTVCIEPNGYVAVDFVADQKGLSLFHCHMQNHMEKGFMSLFQAS